MPGFSPVFSHFSNAALASCIQIYTTTRNHRVEAFITTQLCPTDGMVVAAFLCHTGKLLDWDREPQILRGDWCIRHMLHMSMHLTILFLHPRSSNLQSVFSNNISSDVYVVLVTSMYFIGTGNDSSFGTYSFDSGFHVMTINENLL